MMDHSPPYGVCTFGDFVFLNGPTCESGVGFICCDISGRKLWATEQFDAWSTGCNIATDGRHVYAEQMGFGETEDADRIWQIDPQTRQVRKVLYVRSNAKRKRGIAGLAA